MTKNLVLSLILGISLVILLGISSTAAQEQSIPSWIKNNAKYWSQGQIQDSEFTKGIEYLVNQGIMKIPQTKPSPSQTSSIPSWIKNNAKYWSEGKITDLEFVKGIEYLVESGIIVTNIPADQVQCDPTLWDHVYHPQRLNILEMCTQVSGTIKELTPQPNGDYQIRLALDPNYKFMVNQANVDQQHGNIVLETICQNPSQLQDAVQSCQGWTSIVNIPPVGTHVIATGSYVLDLEHDRLAEIHPVSSIGVILPNGTIWYNKTIAVQNTVPVQNLGAKPNTTSMLLRIDLAEHDYIKRGTIQSMMVEVSDGANPVSGASVTVHVVDALGYTAKDFTGVTDSKGEYSLSWTISSNSKPGSFQVGIDATKDGFIPAHKNFTFDVV